MVGTRDELLKTTMTILCIELEEYQILYTPMNVLVEPMEDAWLMQKFARSILLIPHVMVEPDRAIPVRFLPTIPLGQADVCMIDLVFWTEDHFSFSQSVSVQRWLFGGWFDKTMGKRCIHLLETFPHIDGSYPYCQTD